MNEDQKLKEKFPQLEIELDVLNGNGAVKAAFVIRREGLLLVSTMVAKENSEMDTATAMLASAAGALETATMALGKDIPRRVIVETRSANIVVVGAGPKALLIVVTVADIGLSSILPKIQKTADRVKEILG